MKLVDEYLADIQKQCEYLLTKEQLDTIKQHMVSYAAAAIMDSSIRDEVFEFGAQDLGEDL